MNFAINHSRGPRRGPQDKEAGRHRADTFQKALEAAVDMAQKNFHVFDPHDAQSMGNETRVATCRNCNETFFVEGTAFHGMMVAAQCQAFLRVVGT